MLTNNISEKSNNIMTDSETESIDASIQEIEGNDEEVIKSWKRCTKCRRPTINHEGKFGQNCKLDLLEEDQMKQYEMLILQKIKDKNVEPTKDDGKKDNKSDKKRDQKSSNGGLDPSLIEGLKQLLANQAKIKTSTILLKMLQINKVTISLSQHHLG